MLNREIKSAVSKEQLKLTSVSFSFFFFPLLLLFCLLSAVVLIDSQIYEISIYQISE